MQPLLANPALKPSQLDILKALAHFTESVAIRRSTRLLRLHTGEQVQDLLRFHNTGPNQIPGLIVFSVIDPDGEIDPLHSRVVVLINSRPDEVTFQMPELKNRKLELHPLQRISADPVVRQSRFTTSTGTFRVPGRTAAVFWQDR